mmetsp:Transcript_90081/g.241537  ORF Transcript_90081/g.241537 Transcript_90081/m.241537 type:complete len:221 (-) Transcript_90081:332-994(-)
MKSSAKYVAIVTHSVARTGASRVTASNCKQGVFEVTSQLCNGGQTECPVACVSISPRASKYAIETTRETAPPQNKRPEACLSRLRQAPTAMIKRTTAARPAPPKKTTAGHKIQYQWSSAVCENMHSMSVTTQVSLSTNATMRDRPFTPSYKGACLLAASLEAINVTNGIINPSGSKFRYVSLVGFIAHTHNIDRAKQSPAATATKRATDRSANLDRWRHK